MIEDSICSFSNPFLEKKDLNTFQNITGTVTSFRVKNVFGVPCYIISPKCAEYLIQVCFPLWEGDLYVRGLKRLINTYTLDLIINRHLNKIKGYICFPPLAVTLNDKNTSDCTKFQKEFYDKKD